MSDPTGPPPPDDRHEPVEPQPWGGPPPPDQAPWTAAGATGHTTEPPPPASLLETVTGVFTSPTATLRQVTRHPNIGWAIGVLVAIGLASGIAAYAQPDVATDWFGDLDGGDPFGELSGTWGRASLFVSPITTPIFGAIIALVLHGMARLFQGEGTLRGMYTGAAFAYLPAIANLPAQLLVVGLGAAGAVLAGLVSFGIFVWIIVLTVVAVRENYRLTTGRAVGVVLIPFAVLFVVGVILVVLVLALIFA